MEMDYSNIDLLIESIVPVSTAPQLVSGRQNESAYESITDTFPSSLIGKGRQGKT